MSLHTVVLTRLADKDERLIYAYIKENFGLTYADEFRKKFIGLLELFTKKPFVGRPAKNDPTLRVFLFNKKNKVVYKIDNLKVVVLRILHTKTLLASRF